MEYNVTGAVSPDLSEERIIKIREQYVILDRDLAELYGVETKRINEQVKRNIERFPDAFRFQLTDDELRELVAVCDRFAILKHSSSLPYAFTEEGVAMLSTVLRSKTAIQVSIHIMQSFVAMRRYLFNNAGIIQRISRIEIRQNETDRRIDEIFSKFQDKTIPVEGIFYDGQIFDAYIFVTDLVRSARRRVVLIDNYVDESVLLMFSKRASGVSAEIRTGRLSSQLQLDVVKHDSQYEPIVIVQTQNIHDRFLIVDDDVYHIGASLKDLGKKLFAFSKMNLSPSLVII
ncbi:MAG: ORF6N domain-containing protein [Bacteroidales bacterium]|nr:ORF6N domain-containing protein [Bacteroidales bacterium]